MEPGGNGVADHDEIVEPHGFAAGDELALLESMKMEIPVVPEQPGTVVEIRVQAGEVVQEGDVLVVLQ